MQTRRALRALVLPVPVLPFFNGFEEQHEALPQHTLRILKLLYYMRWQGRPIRRGMAFRGRLPRVPARFRGVVRARCSSARVSMPMSALATAVALVSVSGAVATGTSFRGPAALTHRFGARPTGAFGGGAAWENLTVFHVNPSTYGSIPLNMDTADLLGDMYFDLRSIGVPIECAHPSREARDCNNSEVTADDLVITKLVLEVDSAFGPYGRCNICVNGTDGHGNNSCVDGVYDCMCEEEAGHTWPPVSKPCGPPVGYQNVSREGHECSDAEANWECWRSKVAMKTGGAWYSTHGAGYCGDDPAHEPVNCTWRLNHVVKRINKTCSDGVIFDAVEGHSEDCFEACPDSGTGSARNTSSTCWITCFYDAVLGPNSSSPQSPVAGMPLEALVTAWEAPFRSEDPTQGGCPAVP